MLGHKYKFEKKAIDIMAIVLLTLVVLMGIAAYNLALTMNNA